MIKALEQIEDNFEIQSRVIRTDPEMFAQIRENKPNTHISYSSAKGYVTHALGELS